MSKWPYNSELYMTFREIRKEIPKLDFSNILLTKPIKPWRRKMKGIPPD